MFIALFKYSYFGISGWGIDLNYFARECFALEMMRDHSIFFPGGLPNSGIELGSPALQAESFAI